MTQEMPRGSYRSIFSHKENPLTQIETRYVVYRNVEEIEIHRRQHNEDFTQIVPLSIQTEQPLSSRRRLAQLHFAARPSRKLPRR